MRSPKIAAQREIAVLEAEVERVAKLKAQTRDNTRAAVEQFLQAKADLKIAARERHEADSAFEIAEQHPVVKRWIEAPARANVSGCGYTHTIYRQWVVSTRARTNRNACEAGPEWDVALHFEDGGEREIIRQWLHVTDHAKIASQREATLHQRISDLSHKFPELCSVC